MGQTGTGTGARMGMFPFIGRMVVSTLTTHYFRANEYFPTVLNLRLSRQPERI